MTIQELLKETRLSISDLAKREKVYRATVWKWTKPTGKRSTVLETFHIGGNGFTTEEAFIRFVEGCNK